MWLRIPRHETTVKCAINLAHVSAIIVRGHRLDIAIPDYGGEIIRISCESEAAAHDVYELIFDCMRQQRFSHAISPFYLRNPEGAA